MDKVPWQFHIADDRYGDLRKILDMDHQKIHLIPNTLTRASVSVIQPVDQTNLLQSGGGDFSRPVETRTQSPGHLKNLHHTPDTSPRACTSVLQAIDEPNFFQRGGGDSSQPGEARIMSLGELLKLHYPPDAWPRASVEDKQNFLQSGGGDSSQSGKTMTQSLGHLQKLYSTPALSPMASASVSGTTDAQNFLNYGGEDSCQSETTNIQSPEDLLTLHYTPDSSPRASVSVPGVIDVQKFPGNGVGDSCQSRGIQTQSPGNPQDLNHTSDTSPKAPASTSRAMDEQNFLESCGGNFRHSAQARMTFSENKTSTLVPWSVHNFLESGGKKRIQSSGDCQKLDHTHDGSSKVYTSVPGAMDVQKLLGSGGEDSRQPLKNSISFFEESATVYRCMEKQNVLESDEEYSSQGGKLRIKPSVSTPVPWTTYMQTFLKRDSSQPVEAGMSSSDDEAVTSVPRCVDEQNFLERDEEDCSHPREVRIQSPGDLQRLHNMDDTYKLDLLQSSGEELPKPRETPKVSASVPETVDEQISPKIWGVDSRHPTKVKISSSEDEASVPRAIDEHDFLKSGKASGM